MAELDEKALVARLKRRDEAAFNELVRLYQGRVYHLVFRLVGNAAEAEDLSQEIFVTVFKRIDGFRGDSKLSTWLYRVATNHAKNRLKYLGRRGAGKKKELDELADANALESATMATSARIARPDELAEGRKLEDFVRQALAALPEEQRQLVVLRDLENLTYEEIQSITGLPAGTVKSRLHRARLAMATHVRQLQKGTLA
ncbi:MAG: sigma-70 family RNA polymerase sigma factor [Myxococcota bacterium]